jgi:hypothetical protein
VDLDVEAEQLWADQYWPSGPIVSGQTLLTLRLEALDRSDFGPVTRARFLLDRSSLNAEGGLDLASALPIPGYPVGLLDATTLLSVEPAPGETGAALLNRSRLTSTGAEIEAQLQLDARFGSVHVVGNYAVYLRQPTDSCEPVMTLESVPFDFSPASASVRRQTLDLPGEDYRVFATAEDNLLLTDSGNRAFARVRVGADGSLSLEAFATAPGFVQGPSWEQGILRGARGSRVRIAL